MTEKARLIDTDMANLRRVSEPCKLSKDMLQELIVKMKSAMTTAWTPGVGLAAIQIGLPIRVAIYYKVTDAGKFQRTLINPTITASNTLTACTGEGCLSIPGPLYTTWRYNTIEFTHEVDGKLVTERATGREAQIVQHEVDHMDGILCCDRAKKPVEPGRNEPCNCGSNVKFKKCCGRNL